MNDIAETAQIFLDQLRKNVFDTKLLEKYDTDTRKNIVNHTYLWEILRFLGRNEFDFKRKIHRAKASGFQIYLDILENKIKKELISSLIPTSIDVFGYHKARFYHELLHEKEIILKLRKILMRDSENSEIKQLLAKNDEEFTYQIVFEKEDLISAMFEKRSAKSGLFLDEFETLRKPGEIEHRFCKRKIGLSRLEVITTKKYIFGHLGILPQNKNIDKLKLKDDLKLKDGISLSEKLICDELINNSNIRKILVELNTFLKLSFQEKDILYYRNKFKCINSIYKLNHFLLTVNDNILIECLNNLLRKKEIQFQFKFYDINEKYRIIISNYGIVKTKSFITSDARQHLIFSCDEYSSWNPLNNYINFLQTEVPPQLLKKSFEDMTLGNNVLDDPLFFYAKSLSELDVQLMRYLLEKLGFFNLEDAKDDDLKLLYLTYFHFNCAFHTAKKSELGQLDKKIDRAKHDLGREGKINPKILLDMYELILRKLYFIFNPFIVQISEQFGDEGQGTFDMNYICFESVCDYWKINAEDYDDSDIMYVIAPQFEELFKKSYVLKENINDSDIDNEVLEFFRNINTKDNTPDIIKAQIVQFYLNKIEPLILERLKKLPEFSDLYYQSKKFLENGRIKEIIGKKSRLSLGDYVDILCILSDLLGKSDSMRTIFKDYFKREAPFVYGTSTKHIFKVMKDIVPVRNCYHHVNSDRRKESTEFIEKKDAEQFLFNLSLVSQVLKENHNFPPVLRIYEFRRNKSGIEYYAARDLDDKPYSFITSQNLDPTHTYYIFYEKLSSIIIYPRLIDTATIDAMCYESDQG